MAKKNHLSSVSNSYDNAHEVVKGDPRVDGPYLDDIRKAEAEAKREARTNALNAAAEKRAAEKEAEAESQEEIHTPEGEVTEPNVNVDEEGKLINDPFAAFEKTSTEDSDKKETKDDDNKS